MKKYLTELTWLIVFSGYLLIGDTQASNPYEEHPVPSTSVSVSKEHIVVEIPSFTVTGIRVVTRGSNTLQPTESSYQQVGTLEHFNNGFASIPILAHSAQVQGPREMYIRNDSDGSGIQTFRELHPTQDQFDEWGNRYQQVDGMTWIPYQTAATEDRACGFCGSNGSFICAFTTIGVVACTLVIGAAVSLVLC